MSEQLARWTLEPELDCRIPRKVVAKKRSIVVPLALLSLGIAGGAAVRFANADEPFLWLGPFGLFGFLALLFELDRRSSKWFVERGVPTPAVVVALAPDGANAEDPRQAFLSFDTNDGRHVTIEIPWTDESQQGGETVTVLYFPESPERAMVYDRCDYTALGRRGHS